MSNTNKTPKSFEREFGKKLINELLENMDTDKNHYRVYAMLDSSKNTGCKR